MVSQEQSWEVCSRTACEEKGGKVTNGLKNSLTEFALYHRHSGKGWEEMDPGTKIQNFAYKKMVLIQCPILQCDVEGFNMFPISTTCRDMEINIMGLT